jgi:hypothetical protein
MPLARAPWSVPLAVLLFTGLVAGCSGERTALVAQLQGCGLLSEGRVVQRTLSSLYAPSACYEQCLAEASCEALSAALCRSDLSLPLACDARCAVRCGDGSLVGVESRCNGSNECEDGADERGCMFDLVCSDGRGVPGARCDGAWNCPRGEDEIGCPPNSTSTMCDRGLRWFGELDRCDGYAVCADGADERDCPTFACDDGQRLVYRADSPECDRVTNCRDGSDERGCARLTPCGGP